jgi:hypothetical protein
MSKISTATKVERISSVKLGDDPQYSPTLYVGEPNWDRDRYAATVRVETADPRVAILDELLAFAQPSENECPPRTVVLQNVIDRMQDLRDKLNETYGDRKGQPRMFSLEINIERDDAAVLSAVLQDGRMDYKVEGIVDKALTPEKVW